MKDHEAFLWKEKVSKLLLKFSIPCVISFMVNALYNIVDQIFIWRGIGYLANW
jgi:Na+-driven multidrug efflux pump